MDAFNNTASIQRHCKMSTGRGVTSTAAPASGGLPEVQHLPLDQLQQIQKRLQALIASTGQLQGEIAVVPNFDWPTILARYGSLASQVHSLSSALTSPTSAYVAAQQDALAKHLEEEAKSRNYFMQDEEDEDAAAAALASLPRVKYTDAKNSLPRLAAAPVKPMQGDRAARLGEALRTKLDPDVEAAVSESKQSSATDDPSAALADALRAVSQHDDLSMRALRTWYHVRWRPDEMGQTYDFKMRLGADDDGELDDDEDGAGDEGDAAAENAASTGQETAAADNDEDEQQYEDVGEDEEVDEEMEDIV